MKILIITPRIPFPPFRGDKIKIFNISKNLVLNNEVKILTFYRFRNQLKYIDQLKRLNIDAEALELSFLVSVLRLFAALFYNFPFQVAWFHSSTMKKKIKMELTTGKYDVVYYHLIRTAQYFDPSFNSQNTLNVIDFTDAVSLFLKRFCKIEKNILKKFFIQIEAKRIEKYEQVAKEFHTLFICSESDREYLLRKGVSNNIKIIPNGVDTQYFRGNNNDYEKGRIIFTGNMPYFPNKDAALFFTKKIFPLIINRVPNAKFYIVGQNPPLKIRKLASNNIKVLGYVPDIRIEYLKSAVNVAPMRFGAGSLNKVIESLSLGIPVVATSIAAEGLPKELLKYIFVADSPEKFAERIIEVINNPEIRNNLMNEGVDVVRKMLDWEPIIRDFQSYLENELYNLNKPE